MAAVNERHYASKPVQVDPKTGKPLPGGGRESPNPQSLDNEKEGFFFSFFAAKNKKKMAAMEPPPAKLMASGTLSERENLEVEVISTLSSLLFFGCGKVLTCLLELLIQSYYNIVKRTMIDMVPKAIMLNLVQ
jgi:dynamin 1-like protein